LKIENKDMVLWNIQTKINSKDTGFEVKDQVKEHTSTLMETLIQVNGKMTQKMATEFLKWQLVIFMKEIGLMVKRMVSVLDFSNLGKYRFTNGDIY
jgi:hypothetical protein